MHLYKYIKNYILKSKYTKLIFKLIRYFFNDLADFKIRKKLDSDKKIVIFTSIGDHTYYAKYDRYLERAFNLLNYEVIIVLCNSDLDICQEFTHEFFKKGKISNTYKNIYCQLCKKNSKTNFNGSKIEYLSNTFDNEYYYIQSLFQDYIKNNKPIINFKYKGINFGEHINSGLVRYYGGSKYGEKETYNQNLYKFANASFKTYLSTLNILKRYNIKLSLLHHGIYIPQGVICDLLQKEEINFYTYGMSYRKNTFFYAYKDTYHKRFLDLKNWDKFKFEKKELKELHGYFKNKIINNQDWIDFTAKNKINSFNKIKEIVNHYNKNDIYIMYTNVDWDAHIHFKNNIFKSIYEWIEYSVDYFEKNPNKLLIVRVHPAEVYGNVKSRISLANYIISYKKIKNLIIINSTDRINSYSLMSLSNNFLVYSSKISIELLFFNKKVLIAGEAFVRGKGFTLDTKNKSEYFNDIEELSKFNLNINEKIRSKKFIYFFFFKLMIENKFLKKGSIFNHPFYSNKFKEEDLKKDKHFYNALLQMLKSKKIIQS